MFTMQPLQSWAFIAVIVVLAIGILLIVADVETHRARKTTQNPTFAPSAPIPATRQPALATASVQAAQPDPYDWEIQGI